MLYHKFMGKQSIFYQKLSESLWRILIQFNSCLYKSNFLLYYQKMQVNIQGLIFDLSLPVYLLHPNYKFWELKLHGKTINFRVGKLKQGIQSNTQQSSKTYSTNSMAKQTAISKIEEKLTKGYSSSDAKKVEAMEPEKKDESLKENLRKEQKRSRVFSGEYYEKENEGVKLQINDKRVKITRVDKGVEKYQIRSFSNYDQAVNYCFQQESWLLSDGFRVNNSKFIYSFIEEPEEKNIIKSTKKKQQTSDSKFLSITKMTDDAISHRSRNNSVAKSDRSYHDDGNQQALGPSSLGSPASGPISVLLAQTWDNQIDPKGWIMSEKLDGVRCFWTGTTMYSRNANRFFFPKFFTKNWPKSQMDGELFIDRGKFSETLSAVRKNVPIDQQWQKVKFLVFDVPGLKLPFKKRLQAMQKIIKQVDSPYLKCHAHRVCEGFDDLFKELDSVNKLQGQGLMLRDPESKYENRRSKSLLKVKTFYDDEAEVIGYKPGTGRCLGMVGALRVRNTHGVQFEVGSGMTDQIRRRPPKIGSKITYKYQQFNKDSGKPRFPTYMRTFDKI